MRPTLVPWIWTVAMIATVTAANALMPYEMTRYVSWGTPVITLTFCINELVHQHYGAKRARQLAWQGFCAALVLSLMVAPWRIAMASAAAFLNAQLADIGLFRRIRRGAWWYAPLASSALASTLDTFVFFVLAFAGTSHSWWRLALGDWACKLLCDLLFLAPFRLGLAHSRAKRASARDGELATA